MGATNFRTIATGKTAQDAFQDATTAARYEWGHGGYTGTIAEKTCFNLFTPHASKRWTVDQVERLIGDYLYGTTAKADKACDRLIDLFGSTAIADVWADKWGPAVCIELKGKKATDAKKQAGRAGTRDKAFVFMGLASE